MFSPLKLSGGREKKKAKEFWPAAEREEVLEGLSVFCVGRWENVDRARCVCRCVLQY